MRFKSALITVALIPLMVEGLPAATSDIHGRIHDLDGRPLKNVAISAAETGLRAFSDDHGEFTIHLPAPTRQIRLLFESPGYYPETLVWEMKDQPAAVEVLLTPVKILKEEVTVVAPRLNIPLAVNPAATSVVRSDALDAMPRTIAADEALKSVPGVKVDNQANGERVHLSIRGQGILTERGIRGIQVLFDGIPLNDPTGFVPDLFDVDWAGVQEVEVVRGPVAFLYGGGSAGGVIDIRTRNLEYAPLHGGIWASGGSNGFYKTRGEVSGTALGVAYLVSGSRGAGDGYRDHTAFWANNVYGRLNFNATPRLRLNPFLMGTGFFNQNAEGLNLDWLRQSWRMANPDALTYNEYQRTLRLTGGLTGQWLASEHQRLSFTFYARRTGYKEPVPSSVSHRTLDSPGGSIQYDLEGKTGRLKHHFSSGLDLDGQFIGEYRHPNLGNAVEGKALLSDQSITQNRIGGYLTERLSLGPRWTLLLGARVDRIGNRLEDHLRLDGLDLSGSRIFTRATGRVGLTWSAGKQLGLYASWGQGFLPPATEELYANPAALGGFNRSLVSATSSGAELGARGSFRNRLFYDAALFRLDTENDFERYRVTSRPLETFYHNAGHSRRYGLETSVRWLPTNRLTLSGAYTCSHFVYSRYDSVTYQGDLTGNRLPNSPSHQLFTDAYFEFVRSYFLGVSSEAYSRAYIDATNRTWIDGFGLLHARISKTWQRRTTYGTIFIAGKNLTGKKYIAFTEPDPDGNSYQPGAGREVFAGIQIRF
jgi:iron complex outermembrane receptor protein